MGYCKGIAEYTGIPVLWIRIMTVLYGLTFIGTLLYFFISICIPFKEDVENRAGGKTNDEESAE
jgi:phage shock protein PspC (stress-responsive transcriptional regulator)